MAPTHSAPPVDMPDSLVHYWTMWNEPDLDAIRTHLDRAIASDVEWVDPQHSFRGRDALEANVRTLRSSKPEYRFVIASELDCHHDRVRYRWDMMRKHRVLMRGLDIVAIDTAGLIARVDGFFGEQPPPVAEASSAIPAFLRKPTQTG